MKKVDKGRKPVKTSGDFSKSSPKSRTDKPPFKKDFDKSERPFKKDFNSSDKPFKKDFNSSERPFKKDFDKSDRPFKKDFNSSERPFKKNFDKSDRPFKKDFNSSERPFKKDFNSSERPFKKDFNSSDKPFKKDFNKSERPFKKDFDKSDRPFKKDFDKSERPFKKDFDKSERPFKKDFNSSDKPFKKDFNSSDRPFKKDFNSSERPFKKDFDSSDRPFKKDFNSSERPFKKDFDSSERPFKKDFNSSDRPFKKDFNSSERPFKKDFDKSERPFKKDFNSSDRPFKKDFDKSERPERSDFDEPAAYIEKPLKKEAEKKKKTSTRTPKKKVNAPSFDFNDRSRETSRKPPRIAEQATNWDDMRLNKYLALCGIASRRAAAEIIGEGQVTVNGDIVREIGYRVQPEDLVKLNGKEVRPVNEKVYILLNKPKDIITTVSDERGRKTVMDLVGRTVKARIYPVGRLDRETTGLLLLTNDGDLAQKLSHPSYLIKKVYHVGLNKPLTKNDLADIEKGIELEDGLAQVDSIEYLENTGKDEVLIEIHIGKNRIVRRIFEQLGYEVVKLDRIYYGGLTKKDLPRGNYRQLSDREIIMLKHFTGK